MRRRVQKSEAAAPASSAALAERFEKSHGLIPGVLTVDAVEAGYMPELGKSGLPASLEGDVPAEYRYWLLKDAGQAREVRDALVEASVFTPETVLKVSGEPRRVLKRTFLVEEDPPGPTTQFAKQLPAGIYAATCLAATSEQVVVYDVGLSPKLETVAKAAKEKEPWLGVYPDDQVTKAALLASGACSVFKVRTRPGFLFASNVELLDKAGVAESVKPVEKQMMVRVVKAKATSAEAVEERLIYGVVLQPETEDSQTDIYSAEEVRKTAHRFMEGYRAGNYVAHQHDGKDITGELLVLESFIAPMDFEVEGPSGPETVKKGSWLMAQRVLDDDLWTSVKKGEITGYSIGGDAIRKPEPRPAQG